MLSLNISFYLE
jgi:hypothetical protein